MLWVDGRVQSSASQDAFCLPDVTKQPTKQPAKQPTNQPTSQQTNQPTNQPTNQLLVKPTNQPTPAGCWQETKAGARNGCKYCAAVEMFKIPSGRPLPCRWSKAVNISPVGNHDSPRRPRPRGNNLFKAFPEIPAKNIKKDYFAGFLFP